MRKSFYGFFRLSRSERSFDLGKKFDLDPFQVPFVLHRDMRRRSVEARDNMDFVLAFSPLTR
jgi:hypothetical protein